MKVLIVGAGKLGPEMVGLFGNATVFEGEDDMTTLVDSIFIDGTEYVERAEDGSFIVPLQENAFDPSLMSIFSSESDPLEGEGTHYPVDSVEYMYSEETGEGPEVDSPEGDQPVEWEDQPAEESVEVTSLDYTTKKSVGIVSEVTPMTLDELQVNVLTGLHSGYDVQFTIGEDEALIYTEESHGQRVIKVEGPYFQELHNTLLIGVVAKGC